MASLGSPLASTDTVAGYPRIRTKIPSSQLPAFLEILGPSPLIFLSISPGGELDAMVAHITTRKVQTWAAPR